mmetsp:Transcript_12558/g.19816  ORF Transcript_12558/g.19816 Transcript_12558/m.19816 type:complete len:126 (+) Transcript_12558:3-380(+)
MPHTSTALQCVTEMISKKLHAVPITDAEGKLVGAMDASCLKQFDSSGASLDMPVLDYLAAAAPQALTPDTLVPSSHFLECIKKISDKGTHRAWVVDAAEKPIGVISGTDIFKQIAHGLMARARAD